MHPNILQPGRNCQRVETAGKAAVIVDAHAYFRALDQALDQARETVYILGWEIDSKLPLLLEPGRPPARFLGERLNRLAAASNVRIYILTWDFAMVFAMERQFMPIFDLGWASHRRVHYAQDADHPLGASHHQKVVVIDDALAFVGGIDLTRRRWDTDCHRSLDDRRVDPAGLPYPPAHDIQMAVTGAAARALGALARERWRRCLGKPPCSPLRRRELWPDVLVPDLRDAPVALARTEPAYKGRPEVREVETLFLDSIRAARDCIYIENQYFTSTTVTRALAARLAEPDGPEVIIVLPRNPVGWLEETVMGALGSRVLAELRRADVHGRFGVFYPVAPGTVDGFLKVHSKLMAVDDRLLRVGSANLNNRSMGLDTECDLAVEAGYRAVGEDAGQSWGSEEDVARELETALAVAQVRNRLAAEHLQVTPAALDGVERSGRGLLAKMRSLAGRGEVWGPVREWDWSPAEDISLGMALTLDPEKPIQVERLMDEFVGPDGRGGSGLRWLILAVAAVLALALAWRFTPLRQAVTLDRVAEVMSMVDRGPYTPAVILGVYLAGSLVFMPISLLIAATAVAFPPLQAAIYAYIGCLAASALEYWLGALLGRGAVRRLAGGALNRFSRRLARMGSISVALVRLVPVAPFTAINLVAGASRVSFAHFMAGTLLGLTPGIVSFNLFAYQLKEAVLHPGWKSLAVLLAVAAGLIYVSLRIRKRIEREEGQSPIPPPANP